VQPECERGESRVPKKASAIDPINPRGELALLTLPQVKIEHCQLDICLLEVAFSGINRA
jgi:hypothetical protein